MTVTGERVSSREGGFNPTWQRHRAAYSFAARLLGAGRVLDLACGVGHSFELLVPRETVGVDLDPVALEGQERETHVADMRSLPFEDGSFASVVSVHSIEHVPDPDRVLVEVVRVLEPGGEAVFVTPNRLTFGRPDEIVDPFHFREYDAGELADLCRAQFGSVDLLGIFGSDRYMELYEEERRRLDGLLRLDPLRARRAVPRRVRQVLYDRLLNRSRRATDPRAALIDVDDFELRAEGLDAALDVVAHCRVTRG